MQQEHVIYLFLRRLRVPMITIVVVYSISILGFVLIPGVDDQGNPWRMDFFHAFYFVSFMGTTIGFGEIPYPFTTAQRFWTVYTIYATVIGWLYSITKILALFQEQSFIRLLKHNKFGRKVRAIRNPFYLVCGYGVTGSRLVHRLYEEGIQPVVIDIDHRVIEAMETDQIGLGVPAITGDAADPSLLNTAGLRLKNCACVIALTDDDHTNLAVSIDSKLVFPERKVISRTESPGTTANLASFGTDHIIDPFYIFAEYFVDSVTRPYRFIVKDLIFNPHHKVLPSPHQLTEGHWVVCGYGRFGKALEEACKGQQISMTFIDPDPDLNNAPDGTLEEAGTEAETLLRAGIENSVGIIAGTNDDADNLSIIITARQLKADLITVARQNLAANKPVFRAANINMIMEPGRIIADEIFVLIKTPLLIEFVGLLRLRDEAWCRDLLQKIGATIEDRPLDTWTVDVSPQGAPAIYEALQRGRLVRVGFLCRDPRNRERGLPILPLMIKRGDEYILLPEPEVRVERGDQILLAGQGSAEIFMKWITDNQNVLRYVRSGLEAPGGTVWRWLGQLRRRRLSKPAVDATRKAPARD